MWTMYFWQWKSYDAGMNLNLEIEVYSQGWNEYVSCLRLLIADKFLSRYKIQKDFTSENRWKVYKFGMRFRKIYSAPQTVLIIFGYATDFDWYWRKLICWLCSFINKKGKNVMDQQVRTLYLSYSSFEPFISFLFSPNVSFGFLNKPSLYLFGILSVR